MSGPDPIRGPGKHPRISPEGLPAWLIEEEGLGYPAVLDRMRELRRGTRKAHHRVPDTDEQHEVLRRRAQK